MATRKLPHSRLTAPHRWSALRAEREARERTEEEARVERRRKEAAQEAVSTLKGLLTELQHANSALEEEVATLEAREEARAAEREGEREESRRVHAELRDALSTACRQLDELQRGVIAD